MHQIAKWERWLIVAIVVLMGVVCLRVIREESITVDEIAHIGAGVSYLEAHDDRMNTEHPPLIKVVAALPLVFDGVQVDYLHDPSWNSVKEWGLGTTLLLHQKASGDLLVYRARIPMVLITLALGVTIFYMARSLAGEPLGGFLSLVVYASTPFFFAYGPLVLTDVGVALFSLLAVWTYASLWKDPLPRRAVIFGLSLSGALLSKFSSGLLIPILIVLSLWFVIKPGHELKDVKRAGLLSFLGVGIASLIVYVTYSILFWKMDIVWLLSYKFAHSVNPKPIMQTIVGVLHGHPSWSKVLSPLLLYSLGVAETLRQLPRPTYLLGKLYTHGTWKYFPIVFFYKMTPGFLLLISVLILLTILMVFAGADWGIREASSVHARALFLLVALFTIAAVMSPINIGIRHLSIPIAGLTALLGLIVPLSKAVGTSRGKGILLSIAGIAVAGNIASALIVYPNYFSYFNIFTHGEEKYKISVDSNLDSGQSLVKLREFMEKGNIQSIALDSVGSIPQLYVGAGKEFRCEEGTPTATEWVAVGASRLVAEPDLSIDPAKPLGRCDYLFSYPHSSIAGGAMFVFQVSPVTAARTK